MEQHTLAINASLLEPEREHTRIVQPREVTIDEAYDLAGGHGRYQALVALSITVSQISSMAYLFAIPLFQTFPVVHGCPGLNGTDICESAEQACKYENRWYDDARFNFVTEFDLLCSEYKASYLASAYPVGFLLGSLLFTSLSDMIGRLPVMVLGQGGMILSVLILFFFASYTNCLLCTGLCGFFSVASLYMGYAYSYDSNHSRYVTFYATYVGVVFAVGELLVAGIMWMQVPWRTLCKVYIIFSALYVVFPLFLSEAPRYFYSKGQVRAAERRFRSIARINGAEFPYPIQLKDTCDVSAQAVSLCDKLKLLTTRWVLVRLLLCSVMYFSCGFIYYGISLNVHKFKGNVYLNVAVNAVAEIAADITACILAYKVGPKIPLALSFLIACAAFVVQYFFTQDSLAMSSACLYLGKFGISGSFTLIYTMAGKLFPTAISATAIGILGIFERIAASLSPIIGNVPVMFSMITIGCALSSSIVAVVVAGKLKK